MESDIEERCWSKVKNWANHESRRLKGSILEKLNGSQEKNYLVLHVKVFQLKDYKYFHVFLQIK